MAKHLRIEVNGMEWVNADFDEISFYEGPNGVRMEGKNASRPPSGGGLMDLLTGVSKSRTESMVKEKRQSLVGAVDVPKSADVVSE